MSIRHILIAVIGFICMPSAIAVDYSKSWFQPELEINKAPVCDHLIQYTKNVLSGESKDAYPRGFTIEEHQNRSVKINGKDVYLEEYIHRGCGGACERYQLMAASTPFPLEDEDPEFYSQRLSTSPPEGNFHFLSFQGKYFAFTYSGNENALFQLDEKSKWDKVCSVRITPSEQQIASTNGDFEKTKEILSRLRKLVGQLQQGAGECGSAQFYHRRTTRVTEEFGRLLYAPKLPPNKQGYRTSYDVELENLKLWSLQGIGEFESMKQFQAALEEAISELSNFYQVHFKWNKTQADSTADWALKYAIGSGFRFNTYKPFKTQEEILLRSAILENRPIAEIKSIDISAIDRSPDNSSYSKNVESVLNVAVQYPEAIQYLLESGFDPNHKNAFHKTPLMYAAQHNGITAAKYLIEHGAELNVGTYIPVNRCHYTLRTSNMSPLHYAVRYSDKAFIDMLLDEGASIYHNVSYLADKNGRRVEYPIDWLSRFENPLLIEQDKQHIEKRLKLPSDAERRKLSKSITVKGEQLYGKKDYVKAAIEFNNASSIDNSNYRAINNLALTLLKLGDKKGSLEASNRVIKSNQVAEKEKASAYFNSGLACEGAEDHGIYFNGNRFCERGSISEYVAAFMHYPTLSRGNMITERLLSKNDNHERKCVSNGKRFEAVYMLDYKKLAFIHSVPMEDELTDIAEISYSRKLKKVKKKPVLLKRDFMQDLKNGYYLSVYISNKIMLGDFEVAEGICTNQSTLLIPEIEYVRE